ncbi:hypothetical protein HPB48_013120 [Haemaphysalis longicornis]|uniref:Proline dehydrogenase n=1 Tax=Haemaphysalis longicornis TaxID=44386 RepID=A0A9J6G7K5_HAELO|nr:hypothetical protein HPB48_013120 [Haemaphysalis longicornis]
MYGRNSEAILSCLRMSSELNSEAPLMQLKMSGLLPPKLLKKNDFLFLLGQVHLSNIFQSAGESERLVICLGDVLRSRSYKTSKSTGVKILVDAEYADMNAGIELLGLALMNVFNEGTPIVWNTYQCYLTDGRLLRRQTGAGCLHGQRASKGARSTLPRSPSAPTTRLRTTTTTAALGYNVYKSVPYGPLVELLSYLARRASENRALLKSPVVERRMLAREIRRRLGLAGGLGTGPAVSAR